MNKNAIGNFYVDRTIYSPNADDRPNDTDVNLLVIHGISLPPNDFEKNFIDDFFTNRLDFSVHPYFLTIAHLKVSAHLYIDRSGILTQYVPLEKRAWHAGKSSFQGEHDCNNFSVGIELQGSDHVPYTDEQYFRLCNVSRQIIRLYPNITMDRIVGHCDIAPERKTDPGRLFDWSRFRALLRD
ncbi:MAG: N-acetylmuramoyl-L-alanine amidase [Cellvibrionales bacterium TMED49]|nr:1,6-anhydro-N-acetylmuramyl-L-alanine amidase AmpD [Porticoccaceae bacterium]OUU38865.1 MAG: N-acetylmuramoyl-L-alanine amidase [Cellvibrionales bacterium TMED49]|tara:strand:- start:1267 stop:1815 length:549 start_codon:yes stop_codon:yes gene_type:complete